MAAAVSANATTFLGTEVADTGVLDFVASILVSGTLDQRVYMESSGTLDFYYLVTNSSASVDNIGRMTTNNFTGFSTGVSYLMIPFGYIPPSAADRSVAGDTVGFEFQGPSGNTLAPGTTSAWLEISTNATNFGLFGSTSVIDGGSGTVSTYSPLGMMSQSPAPEPTTMMTFLGGGVVGLGMIRLRRRFCKP